MKTEWVKVCVRPEQSFTRAILEIYMNDGGTLGEVIHALRRQKQYRIIQVGAAVQDHTEAVLTLLRIRIQIGSVFNNFEIKIWGKFSVI